VYLICPENQCVVRFPINSRRFPATTPNIEPGLRGDVSGKPSGIQHSALELGVPTTKEALWRSQRFARRLPRPGEIGILHRGENPERADGQRVHHFRLRNRQQDVRHRA